MIRNRFHNTDWVGQWYLILKERGENDLVSMGRGLRQEDGFVKPVDKYSFSHSIMDGTSAVPHYFEELGEKIVPRETGFKKKISLWTVIKLTFQSLSISPESRPQWKFVDTDRRPEDIHEYAKFCFNKEETKKVKEFCKENKLSENAYIIRNFSKLILEMVDNPTDEMSWLFPVNVRGIINKRDPKQNHSSFIPINVSNKTTAGGINNQIRSQLKSLRYIGIWWVHHLGVIFGKGLMRKLSHRASKRSFWLGTVSNVGEWEANSPEYKSLGDDESWFFAAPGSNNFPIGLIIMTFNGKMGFSLKIHPSICDDSLTKAKEILAKLRQECLKCSVDN